MISSSYLDSRNDASVGGVGKIGNRLLSHAPRLALISAASLFALVPVQASARQAGSPARSSADAMPSRNPVSSLEQFPTNSGVRSAGTLSRSAVGTVGQRKNRDNATIGVAPTGRLNSRIANRVQSRIRNRIDRYYDPEANATSPFQVAADQARLNTVNRTH